MKSIPNIIDPWTISTSPVNNFITSVKYLHHFSKKFYWEASLGYEGKGARMKETFYQTYQSDRKFNLHYLDCSISFFYTIKNLGKASDFELGLGSYFSPLLNGIQEGKIQDGRTSNIPREAIKYNSIIISRNNTLNQALPAVFRPFDIGGIITARIRKKQFLFSSSHRFGFSNLLASNTSNLGIYHHSAFSISLAYVLLKIK